MNFRSALFDAVALNEAEDASQGDFVLRRGKYFEIGDYPDKDFSLNDVQADAAIADFTPVPINLEHMSTLLDGKLGTVQRLWRQGSNLMAEYAIPAWLNRVTEGRPIKISSEWDRETRRPLGAALVLSPRIADAVMMTLSGVAPAVPLAAAPPEISHNSAHKEGNRVSLLGKLAAFLRGEGLIENSEISELAAGEGASVHQTQDDHAVDFRHSAEFQRMATTLKEQESVIASLNARFSEQQQRDTLAAHHAAIANLVREGRITAGEADQWRKVSEEHPAAFSEVLQTLQSRHPLPQFSAHATHRVTPDPEAAAGKLIALTRERARDTGERYETAFSVVCRENPVLAAAHAAAAPSYSAE